MFTLIASSQRQRNTWTAIAVAQAMFYWSDDATRLLIHGNHVVVDEAAYLSTDAMRQVISGFDWWSHATMPTLPTPPPQRDGGVWGHSVMTGLQQNGIVEMADAWRHIRDL